MLLKVTICGLYNIRDGHAFLDPHQFFQVKRNIKNNNYQIIFCLFLRSHNYVSICIQGCRDSKCKHSVGSMEKIIIYKDSCSNIY